MEKAKQAEVVVDKINLQNYITEEQVEEEYNEDCDCEEIMTTLTETVFGSITMDSNDYEATEYLCDDEDLFDYATAILEELNVPDDEIDNYMCGTLLDDSFLDFEEDEDGNIEVSVNIQQLYEFLIDIEEAN